MIKQPKRRPSTLTNRKLGFDFKEAVGLIVLAIGIDGAVEEFAAGITLRPDFQATVRHRIVLGGVGSLIPDLVIPLGRIERSAREFLGEGHGESASLTKRLRVNGRG